MWVPQLLQNHLLHALDIRKDVGVPKPDDAPAALFEPRRAPVIVCIVGVLPAISFNDQATFEADEIDDERSEAMLAAEFEAA
jgi:hypothetical protein